MEFETKTGAGVVIKVWNIGSSDAGEHHKSGNPSSGDSVTDRSLLRSERRSSVAAGASERFLRRSDDSVACDDAGRECRYVANDIKTVDGAYIGMRNLVSADVKSAVQEMMNVKDFWHKTDGRAALHGIISLPESESDVGNAPRLMALADEVLGELFPDHQAVYAVHTNTDNLHVHFIVNAVGLKGMKIHQPKGYISHVVHPCLNRACEKYGFTQNDEWKKTEKPPLTDYAQIKINLRDLVDKAIEMSDTFDEFIGNLKSMGVRANVGKYISLRTEDMPKAVRTGSLGRNYSLAAICERIMTRRDAFVVASDRKYGYGSEIPGAHTDLPTVSVLGKYKDLSKEQQTEVVAMLRKGINPWQQQRQNSWQLQNVARDFNTTMNAGGIIQAFSADGKAQSALDGIIEAKKAVSAEKRDLKAKLREYKPVVDIYRQMQRVAKRAYLYEHGDVTQYKPEYEQYLEYTRRLRDGYGKSVDDVAEMLQSYYDRLLYLDGQLDKLSSEYKEIKKYCATRNIDIGTASLYDLLGIDRLLANAKAGLIATGESYIVSDADPGVTLVVTNHAETDENGKPTLRIELAVVDKNGNILESGDTTPGMIEFRQFVEHISKEYKFNPGKRFTDKELAEECRRAYEQAMEENGTVDEEANENRADTEREGNSEDAQDNDGRRR